MSTQRPFFANFFGAFRARTSPSFQAKSSTSVSPSSLAAVAHISTAANNATTSAPKSITNQAQTDAITYQSQTTTIVAPVAKPASSQFSGAALSTSPGHHFYGPHLPRSSGASSPVSHNANITMSPPGQTPPITRGRQRRGSDSSNSSGVFMDALGSDKWYIGGRTAGGDERFYRLGLVTGGPGKRVQSLDRLSL